MKRGELWVAAGGGDYTGKPRPVVIVQDDRFEATGSVTVCALTSDPTDAPLFRILLSADPENRLHEDSRVMVDKITTVRRERLIRRIGSLSVTDMRRIDRAMLVFLGIARTAYAHGSGRESLPPDVEVEVRAGERVECSLYVPADGATT